MLEKERDAFHALHLLGIITAHTRRRQEAAELLSRAVTVNPRDATAQGNLGFVLLELGRPAEALDCFEHAIAIDPNIAEAHNNRGNALRDLGRPAEALQNYERALLLKSDIAEAHYNRGVVLDDLGRRTEALQSFECALALNPDYAEAFYNRGCVLLEERRPAEALDNYERAIALKPSYAEAHNNRGNALRDLGRIAEALQSYERAIALKPDYAAAFYNRGNALHGVKRLDEALQTFERAIALAPDYAEAHNNRGVVLGELARPEAALQSYERATVLEPEYASAHYNLATCRLLLGDFANGWPEYEWRWKLEANGPQGRNFVQPLWLGKEPLKGKTILLHSEQGFGDTLQFCRYASEVAARDATVVLEVQAPLTRLLSGLEGVTQVISTGDPLPPFDYHCPLLSLPLAFRTDLRDIKARIPYIRSDATLTAAWIERLGITTKPRIGIVWSGNAAQENDPSRSIALADLLPLISDRAEWICVQKELRDSDKTLLASRPDIRVVSDELRDFADTAALLELLHVVITVDTSVAHLAGAMGKTVWILLSSPHDWRWLLNRQDSPWYPTARIFRQSSPYGWSNVIADLRRELLDNLEGSVKPRA